MATYDETTNTWILADGETIFELTEAGDADIQGNDIANEITGNGDANQISGAGGDDTLRGGDGSNHLFGGEGADSLVGGSDSDILDGETGADTMEGGAGDDTYIVDDEGDVFIETADGGTDWLIINRSFSLVGTQFENVTLTAAGTATGNDLANVLWGSTEADLVEGGKGNDELGGGDGADELSGGEGNDTLEGGAGADVMRGGVGDDVYVIEDATDVVEEFDGEQGGSDEIRTSVENLSLAAYANIENLTLLFTNAGTGNDLDNTITGNGFDNSLGGGDGNDTLIGAEGADTLNGGADNDTLDGGADADEMVGGAGDDTYIVNDLGDVVVELADGGTDTIISASDIILTGTEIENATLTGDDMVGIIGNDYGNVLTGNGENNGIVGGNGNDTLDGGEGADGLSGGQGDDVYVVDNAIDSVTEAANEGTDHVFAGVSWSLTGDQSGNVENLTLTGSANINGAGNELWNTIVGNDKDNSLWGEGGNDVLTGNGGHDRLIGGLGADILSGGLGDDTYVIDQQDTLSEAENDGRDTVEAGFNHTLLANFENLTLLDGATAGTGNALDNVILGNAAANTLIGLDGNDRLDGGLGADRMEGGNGSDTYIVDNAGDVIVESGIGTDTVNAHLNYTLGADLEKLILHGNAIAMMGIGNALDNEMFGNNGATTLDGGAGNDLLEGGEGNDLLQGGDGNDRLQDYLGDDSMVGGAGDDDFAGGRGNDTLDGGAGSDTTNFTGSRANYIITANADGSLTVTDTRGANGDGTDVLRGMQVLSFKASGEIMTLQPDDLPPLPLPPPLILKGNKKNNKLTAAETDDLLFGLAGNDVLKGLGGNDRLYGGTGKDKLYGGTGQDVFVFNSKPNKKNRDKVVDFKVKDDTVWLDNRIYKKLGKKGNETNPKQLKKAFFTIGDKPKDKNDFVFYNKKTGGLFYDADGNGAGAAVQIATLPKKLKLKYTDFFVV